MDTESRSRGTASCQLAGNHEPGAGSPPPPGAFPDLLLVAALGRLNRDEVAVAGFGHGRDLAAQPELEALLGQDLLELGPERVHHHRRSVRLTRLR